MRRRHQRSVGETPAVVLVACCLLTVRVATAAGQRTVAEQTAQHPEPLPVEYLQVQGLRRAVRFYRPERLANRPALVLALHGSGGDGERFRRFTAAAFERAADKHGFLVAYPDALGGQWNDCRARAPYHEALAEIDEIAFLRAVIRHAQDAFGRDFAGVFAVGYSNGGHLVFRLAFEAPTDFVALAAIGAHLPALEERDCRPADTSVSILIASGTDDPINPWAGGDVRLPDGGTVGRVLSAEQTAAYVRGLSGATGEPEIAQHADRDANDGTRVETRRWVGQADHEIVLMITHGGGHTLPHPAARFPAEIVGRSSRDIDGADEVWKFFARQLRHD
jgi:polyhydroxybutyrate depolymerase